MGMEYFLCGEKKNEKKKKDITEQLEFHTAEGWQ